MPLLLVLTGVFASFSLLAHGLTMWKASL